MPPPDPTALPFWEARLRRFGHTGWADAATYHYDQRLRLKAVECVIAASPQAPRRLALDYGCGVGDFAHLLSRHFEQVIACDVSEAIIARALCLNPAPSVHYTFPADEVFSRTDGVLYDLILSITVLQHVADDAALQVLLGRMAAHLSPHGEIIVMETFADVEQAAGYIKRRTVAGLLARFEQSGLVLRSSSAFYHPTEQPTPTFKRYRQRWTVKLLGRLAGWGVPTAHRRLAAIAKSCSERDADFMKQALSPTRLMVFGLAANATSRG